MANPEDMIKQCVMRLQAIGGDKSIPRNIRAVADETRKILLDEKKSIGLRAADALSKVDELSNSSNMPQGYARTTIWEVVSILEAIPLNQ